VGCGADEKPKPAFVVEVVDRSLDDPAVAGEADTLFDPARESPPTPRQARARIGILNPKATTV
jgi:hypothetical protein